MKNLPLPILALSLLTLACSGGSGSSSSGTLNLTVTDAPIDPALVEEARISVDEIRVHPQADSEGGFLTIYDGDPIDLDLLDLRNGITESLVSAEVPAADYRQIRLHVASAYLRLVNGNEYSSDDDSLKLTSQDTSGFKVFIDPAVTVQGGFSTDLLLDIDLGKTFRPIPANDPENATSYSLHPVIRAANISESGEIRGIVTVDDGAGVLVGEENVAVYILPPGETDPANSVASSATGSDGGYAILGLPAGSYDVLAQKDLLEGRLDGVTVTVGSSSNADITIE
jgi:hypothetical protein